MSANIKGELTLEEVVSDTGCIKHLCPVDGDGMSILTVVEHDGVKFAAVYDDDEARRLVACWNAFDGLPTSQIESMVNVPEFFFKHMDLMDQRCELLKALQKVLQWIDDNCETTGFDSVEAQADAAIAKATKDAP